MWWSGVIRSIMEFGEYTLIESLAKGGMAEVFRARRAGAEGFIKEVAIKRILPAYSEDREFVRLFINEARLAAELSSDNIVQIHDFNHVHGVHYIAMELVEGKDLRRVLVRMAEQGRPMPHDLACHIVAECCKGLMVAHEKRNKRGEPLNLIHRDISPHNILLSYAGAVKLSDFGIARAAIQQHGTASDVIRGKVPYMSPEQVQGRPLDLRSDLFSLGIVLFELNCGRKLYSDTGSDGLVLQVARAQIPDPAGLDATISPPLRQLILGLLSRDARQRPASAREVLTVMRNRGLASDRSLELAELMEQLFPKAARTAQRAKKTIVTSVSAASDESDASDAASAANAATSSTARERPGAIKRTRSLAKAPPRDGKPLVRILLILAIVLMAGTATGLTIDLLAQKEPVVETSSPPKGATGLLKPGTIERARTRRSDMTGAPVATNRAASVQVISEPAGAEVLVDGLPTGYRAPVTFGLAAGRHRLAVRLPGGESVAREEPFAPGERRVVRLRLPKAAARDSARLHRRRRGTMPKPTTPMSTTPMSTALMKAPRQAPTPRPTQRKSHVSFWCNPWSNVVFKGRHIGATPAYRRLPPGRYRVTFSNPNLRIKHRVSFRVSGDGKPIQVNCRTR